MLRAILSSVLKFIVIPAQAGIHIHRKKFLQIQKWISACAGMTNIIAQKCLLKKLAILSYLFILLLTGCTTVSPKHFDDQATSALPTANLKISKIQYWDMHGKIAVKTDQKGWNASFNWLQKQDNYFLSFFGPLGANRISLEGNRYYAVLQTGNQNFEASNAEVLLQRRLGWYLPVNNIYYWVRGIPAPGPCHKILRNSKHDTLLIEQQGWRVIYDAYQMINGHRLPTLIELENPKLFIRIAIYQWNL